MRLIPETSVAPAVNDRLFMGQNKSWQEEVRERRPATGPGDWYARWGKRWLDVAAASLALVMLSPLLLAVAAVVRITLGGPVFFTQLRPGRHGRPFRIVKFRTMRTAQDADGRPLPDADRLDAVGRILRSTSIDELPELWNVLVGDMSLVGPRPLLTEYLPLYSAHQAQRHSVRPGLTGWAQINGRNAISWEQKFDLDAWYVDNFSCGLDLWIMWSTVSKVLARQGITSERHVSSEPFRGSPTTVVIGAGGHGKVAVATAQAAGVAIDAIYDDRTSIHGTTLLGIPVRGPVKDVARITRCRAIIAIGDNHVRSRLAESLPCEWLTIVHPTASVHSSTSIGPGTLILAGAVVQPDCHIGSHVIVNTGACIDHDCRIDSYTSIGPGAILAGNVNVGETAMIGAGAAVIPSRNIGPNARLGAGAVAITDVPANATAVGCPAREIPPKPEAMPRAA